MEGERVRAPTIVFQTDGVWGACPTSKQKSSVLFFSSKTSHRIAISRQTLTTIRVDDPIPLAGGNRSIALRFGFAFRRHNLRESGNGIPSLALGSGGNAIARVSGFEVSRTRRAPRKAH